MGDREKRILDALEKAGWHLKPAIVADTIRDIDDDDEEGERGARILTERELEAKVRRELLDTDLSYSGARFLASQQRILPTPCVLQVASVQDVSQSKSNQGSNSSGRLLHVRLTDGHSFVKAIEHRHVPSLSLDIAPGTKVTLQGSVTLQSDMFLLDPNTIRIEGGHVAALHEAWEMQRKYAGALSRSTADGSSGPPPFRGLNTTTRGAAQAAASKPTGAAKPTQDMREQAGASTQDMRASKQDVRAATTTGAEGAHVRQPPSRMRPGAEPYRPRGRQQSEANTHSEAPSVATSLAEVASEIKPPTVAAPPTPSAQSSEPEPKAEGRVREKAPEVAPVQNRQAAQKLLDRRTDAGVGAGERGRGRGRGPRRGRYDDDEHDERVMTLDEWEAKRSTAPTPSSSHAAAAAIISDEELAMRLQEQFNMEDSHDVKPKQLSAAEQLRQSMFSYVPEQSSVESSRGRGRGRGGRGRGRR